MSLHFTVKLRVNENIPVRNCLQEHPILLRSGFHDAFNSPFPCRPHTRQS